MARRHAMSSASPIAGMMMSSQNIAPALPGAKLWWAMI